MNLFTIPPHVRFLDAIAAEWLRLAGDRGLDLARGLMLLPTRRSARALAEAFLRITDGRPLLLPRIVALGALDEAPLALAGALDLPPAVEPARRLAELARLILGMDGAGGAPRSADAAWRLAAELAALMDEAERAGIDLARKLPDAADAEFAAHWQQTLQFLSIVTRAWPDWLAEQGLMNPAARQVALLDAQAGAWAAQPPGHPVWVVGTTGGIPAVARLLKAVAGLEQGRVVLPGLDEVLSNPAWDVVEASHPQAGLRQLLRRMDARRGDVRLWEEAPPGDVRTPSIPIARTRLLSAALLPARALDEWHAPADPCLDGLTRLHPADPQEEAVAIALILREALEKPDQRAALITPDRELAGRVAAELGRFGVIADDSAGEPLAETPPAVFLRLLARAVAEQLAPVPLLALLKHPLAAAGLSPAACRAAARSLEIFALRGPRPPSGFIGLRRALAAAPEEAASARDLLACLESCLAPLFRLLDPARGAAAAVAPAALLAALAQAGEALAATDTLPGPALLWAGEEGEALAELLGGAQGPMGVLPPENPAVLPGLLDALLEGIAVRSRRALRGLDAGQAGGQEHPRIFIWGLLEARLQSVEVAVLGGLLEGVWPPATDPGPWLSRPMRARVGLPSPEEAVGQAAHDFVSAACAAPMVVLSAPRRRDNAPAVPARWLARLDAYLAGAGAAPLPAHPAVGWARGLDRPDGPARPIAPPCPAPALALRPRRLSVTQIETWLRDPFAIYARTILRLKPLDPIDQITDVMEYGTLVHAGLHRFIAQHGTARPANMAGLLEAAMQQELLAAGLREALLAWWAPRLGRIAAWIAETERERGKIQRIAAEVSGNWTLPGLDFQLTGRADRIEARADGTLAILDYKTGALPTQKAVAAGLAPQLPLEAAMAQAGAFADIPAATVADLTYWHLTGGAVAGKAMALGDGDAAKIAALVRESDAGLRALIAAYDDPAQPYLAQPWPGAAPRFSDYAQLARVGEWSAAGDTE